MKRSDYYTPPEAAEAMMCSALHVRQLILTGKLPAYSVGNRRYIPKTAVEEMIKQNTTTVTDADVPTRRVPNKTIGKT